MAQPDYGFLGNIADSILRPIASPFLTGAELFNMDQYARNGGIASQYQPRFQTSDAMNNAFSNPIGTGAQQAAGFGGALLPFLLPGAGSLGQAALGGALSGGALGFSNANLNDPGNIASSIGTGALFGGATAGALHGLGNILGGAGQEAAQGAESGAPNSLANKLRQGGEDLQYNAAGVKVPKGAGLDFTGAKANDIAGIQAGLDRYGLNGINHNNISQLGDLLGNERESILTNNPFDVQSSKIVDSLLPQAKALNPTLSDEQAAALIRSRLSTHAGIQPQSLDELLNGTLDNSSTLNQNDLKTIVDNTRGQANNVFKGKAGVDATDRLDSAIHNMSNDLLKTNPALKNAGYGDINEIYRALYSQNPNFIQNANGGGISSLSRGRILGSLINPVKAGVGKGMVGAASLLEGGGINPGGALGAIGNVLGSQPIQAGAQDAIVQGLLNRNNQSPTLDQSNLLPMSNRAQLGGIQAQQTGGGSNLDKLLSGQMSPQQMQLDMLKAGIKPATISQYMSILGNGQRKVSVAQTNKINQLNNKLGAIDQLQQAIQANQGKFGAIQGGGIGDLFANLGLDPQHKALQAQLAAAGGVLGSGYKGALPTLGDSADSALAKLDALKQQLAMESQNNMQGYQQGGFNVGGFNPMMQQMGGGYI